MREKSDISLHRANDLDMLQTGDSLLCRRLDADTMDEFSLLPDWLAAGMTDYVAIITRFAAEVVIGEMHAVYSSRATKAPDGFNDGQIATLERIVPYLAFAIKSVSLARMIRTLMETYPGRGASRIAAMCRSVDAVLISAAFADVGDIKRRLVVGRYALRSVSHPRSCFLIAPDSKTARHRWLVNSPGWPNWERIVG